MKRLLTATVLGMGSLAAMLWWQPTVHGADDQQLTARSARSLLGGNTLDVAIDATKFQFQRDTAVLPTNLIRGDTFITEGPIYPGGTIPLGSTAFPPANVAPI